MTEYDPPQPSWKRALAGVLDLLLALAVFFILIAQAFGESCPDFLAPTLRWCVGLNLYALAAIVGLTISYFVVLGQTGGTLFQRLFGMRRPRAYGGMRAIVKTLVSPDGKRRVQIYQGEDGRFAFVEERRLSDRDGEPRWRPYPFFAAFCDSPEASEQQARAAIGWVGLLR
jgi:hypothetical protein